MIPSLTVSDTRLLHSMEDTSQVTSYIMLLLGLDYVCSCKELKISECLLSSSVWYPLSDLPACGLNESLHDYKEKRGRIRASLDIQ